MNAEELDSIAGWFAGRIADGVFAGSPTVTSDGSEILVWGTIDAPEVGADRSPEYRSGAEAGRIARFRETTRGYRISVARQAEHLFDLPVTWGVTCGATSQEFAKGGSGRRRREDAGGEPKPVVV